MDNPVFKLEGVVHERSAETLQDFEGPLDLILFLLSKNKIEIQDIPIALILDQYLAYLEQRKQLDIEYARQMSPWFDLKIILRTFTAFIQKENV